VLHVDTFSENGCFVAPESGFTCSKCGSGNLVIIPTRSGAVLMCANCTNSQKMIIVKRDEEEE